MLSMPKSTLIESNLPFSESLLWRLQYNAYELSGPRAWKISNNPYLARSYAQQTIAALRDWKDLLNPDQPLYILEIGAGSGRFSYLFFQELLSQLPFNQKICLIISDNVDTYLNFWENHPKLKPYIESGQIDFANYDPTQKDACILIRQNIDISTSVNPIIAITNYFFAALPNDLFRYSDDTLEQGMPVLTSEGITAKILREQPPLLKDISVKFDYFPLENSTYYRTEPEFNTIIESYRKELPNQVPFLIPTESLRSIRNLKNLSKNGVLIIGGDKSFHSIEDLCKNCDHRPIVTDFGDINVDVNGDALAKYVMLLDGEMYSYPSPPLHDYKDVHFSNWVIRFGPNGTQTSDAFNSLFVNAFSPLDCHKLLDKALSGDDTFTIDQVLSLIRLSNYDPEILNFYKDLNIKEIFHSLKEEVFHVQETVVNNIWNNYFWISKKDDRFGYMLAQAFYYLKDYHKSKTCIEQLIQLSGDSDQFRYLLGLCYLASSEPEKAQEQFKRVLKMNPDHKLAKKHLT